MLKALIAFTRRAISVRFVSVHVYRIDHYYINPYGRVESNRKPTVSLNRGYFTIGVVVGDGWFDTGGSASLRGDSAICLKTYNDRFGWSGGHV